MDFMNDSLVSGRRFRTLNIIDDFNRECLSIEIDTSLPSERVIRVLERVCAQRGYPRRLRTDNGPEFLAAKIDEWAGQHGVYWDYIKPGKPAQNGYIERFNRTYREDVLGAYLFTTLEGGSYHHGGLDTRLQRGASPCRTGWIRTDPVRSEEQTC